MVCEDAYVRGAEINFNGWGVHYQQAILHREEIIKREMLRTWKQRTSDMFKHLEKEVG